MNRRILHLAIPSIVSNITVPLLGLVDVTIMGHLGATAYIGAIAVGGLLFNILYWNFGFLRMGTSGLTSQAYGRKDKEAEIRVLVQAVSVGLFSALAMLILQYPIERLAFRLLDTSAEVEQYAVTYFRICIWDEIVDQELKRLKVQVEEISPESVIEVDTLEELSQLDSRYKTC